MLLEVRWDAEPQTVPLGDGSHASIGRGMSCKSELTWAERWGVDRGRVRRFFDKLEKDGMITQKSNRKTTIITICKYDSYNNPQPTDDQQAANKRPQNNKGNKGTKPTTKVVGVYTEAELLSFQKFKEYIASNAPRVDKMKEPFSIDQYMKIKNKLYKDDFPGGKEAGKKFLLSVIVNMGNWAKLHNNISAYLTFVNWANRDLKKIA